MADKKKGRRKTSSGPTIKDVAREAGVSIATVSNIINGRKEYFSEDTQKRVAAVMKQLQYRPNARARAMRSSRNRSFALIFVDEEQLFLQDPFPAAITSSFSSYLNRRGYLTVVHGCSPANLKSTAAIQEIGIDGCCLMLSGEPEKRKKAVRDMLKLQIPLVLIQETDLSGVAGDFCIVRQADFDGGLVLGNHFLERGYQSAVFLGVESSWAAPAARYEGLRAAFSRSGKRGLKASSIASPSQHYEDVRKTVYDYLRKTRKAPDVLVCNTDQMAIAAYHAIQDHGLDVPTGIALTGFNGLENRHFLGRELTTVESPAQQLGEQAARALIERTEGESFAVKELVLPVSLRIGETT
ncbi:MAG: LacI family DNA-binding transcriptional regulator [Pseudomonadota bacterium]